MTSHSDSFASKFLYPHLGNRSLRARRRYVGAQAPAPHGSAPRRGLGGLIASSACLLALAFAPTGLFAQTVQTFNTPGNQTWTAPTGVTSVQVEAWGGGGGGGGCGENYTLGGGGAGGSYVRYTVAVTPGTIYQYTVGAGGAGGTGGASSSNNGGPGATGGSSYFGNSTAGNPAGASVLAVGGGGGAANNTAGNSTTLTYTASNGGVASNTGNLPTSGATFDYAGTNGTTPAASTTKLSGAGGAGAGATGSSGGGAGGAGASTAQQPGNPGSVPGGGGGGGIQVTSNKNGAGGLGAGGQIVLTYTSAAPTIVGSGSISQFSTGQGTASAPSSFSASGSNLTANITVAAPAGFEVSISQGSGYASSLMLTPSSGSVAPTTLYVRLAAADAAGAYSGNIVLSSTGASSVDVAIPACTVATPFTAGNLAVEQLAANATSSTFSVIELNPSAAAQSAPVNTYYVPSTGTSALRQSSAGSTGRLAMSNDQTLLAFTGFEDPTGVTDETSITLRGAASLSQAYLFTLQASYTDSAGTGDQTRGATFNGGTWYMADKNGIWLNGATTAANTTNVRPVKSFGGTVYALSDNTTNVISTVSADGTTLTGLNGLPTDGNAVDFYMLSSGANGSAFDLLYILDGTTVSKFSLVGRRGRPTAAPPRSA
jgi:hypothetical protein